MPVGPYAARLTIDYPERLDRVTTFFRLIWVIPIAIVLGVITGSGTHMMVTAVGEQIVGAGGGLLAGLAFAMALMICRETTVHDVLREDNGAPDRCWARANSLRDAHRGPR